MTLDAILSVAALALVDSTSIGTLLIPTWLLLMPGQVRALRVLTYLATIGLFYFAAGLALLGGATAIGEMIRSLEESDFLLWVQLAVGIGLFAVSFRFDSKKGKSSTPRRLSRWRERATGDGAGSMAVVGLALAAGGVEVVTMVPYLAAIGILSSWEMPLGLSALTLAGYCTLMIAPALVLLAARLAFGRVIDLRLAAFERWMSRNASSATGWILGIAGFLLARDAAFYLGFFDTLID